MQTDDGCLTFPEGSLVNQSSWAKSKTPSPKSRASVHPPRSFSVARSSISRESDDWTSLEIQRSIWIDWEPRQDLQQKHQWTCAHRRFHLVVACGSKKIDTERGSGGIANYSHTHTVVVE